MKRFSKTMVTLLILALFLNLIQVSAWSNGGYTDEDNIPRFGTHDWMAMHSLDMLSDEKSWWLRDNLDLFLLGTELPDNSYHSMGIGDTSLHHVYYDCNMSLVDDSAAVRAQEEYMLALEYFESGSFDLAAVHAGAMSHYICDLGVFGHVMGKDTCWGSEIHHSDYESSADTRMDEYPVDGFTQYIVFDEVLSNISASDACLDIAFDTTFDVDDIYDCVWMDTNYGFSNSTFEARAGESVNLCVNKLADVLSTLYNEADPEISLANFDYYFREKSCIMVQPSTSTEKPRGCAPAMVSDWLASAYIHTRLNNCVECLDTESLYVDQVDGSSLGGLPVISFGGPVVNPIVSYCESDSTPLLDRSPVKYVGEGGNCSFKLWNDSMIPDASLPLSVINEDEDMFLIEVFQNSDEQTLLIVYGFGWQGTYAAGKYFDKVIYPNLDDFKNQWVIVHWMDTSLDGFVDSPGGGDTYIVVATG